MNKFFELIYAELRAVPMTLFMVTSLAVVVGLLAHDHVSVAQFDVLREQIRGVDTTLKADHLDTRLHLTQKERYDIAQHIRDLQDRHQPVDQMILDRQEALRIDESELQREVAREDHTK